MGLRLDGIIPALVLPMILTVILFLGPLVQSHLTVPLTFTLRMYFGKNNLFFIVYFFS